MVEAEWSYWGRELGRAQQAPSLPAQGVDNCHYIGQWKRPLLTTNVNYKKPAPTWVWSRHTECTGCALDCGSDLLWGASGWVEGESHLTGLLVLDSSHGLEHNSLLMLPLYSVQPNEIKPYIEVSCPINTWVLTSY